MFKILFSVLVLALNVFAKKDTLYWGPYKPNVYFGMRPNEENTFNSGLLWFKSNNLTGLSGLRHESENTDTVKKFAWSQFDPRLGGRQVIEDNANGVTLTTDLVKSEDGQSWEVQISGKQSKHDSLTLFFYAGLEAEGDDLGSMVLDPKTNKRLTSKGSKGDISLNGKSSKLGEFKFTVTEGTGSHPSHHHDYSQVKPGDSSHYCGLVVPENTSWRAREIVGKLLQQEVSEFLKVYDNNDVDVPVWSVFSLNNKVKEGSNFHFVQKTFEGDFNFRVSFVPKGHESFLNVPFEQRFEQVLTNQLEKFEKSFDLKPPYNSERYKKFAMEMVSSIAGGIGFFYGDTVVKGLADPEKTEPRSLFTGTPSRPFFPRGFYWDEGFNMLALMNYDTDLVLRIFNSWFDTMDEDGYIQREQILGDEGRFRVPDEFVMQDPEIANPPTLLMALSYMDFPNDDDLHLLKELYPKLQKHFEWFKQTQHGECKTLDREYPSKQVYRWRGRTKTHIFASGLDDYPRALEPSEGEIHVDLMSWVAAMARSLSMIAKKIGDVKSVESYNAVYDGVVQNLEAVHWSDEHESYCDIALDEFEEDYHECHVGYVTILPFMLKLVPETDSTKLLAILNQLADPRKLYSIAGVRSLSRDDEYFGTEEDYWRGAVWNNMNYLTLDALQHYASPTSNASWQVKDKCAEVYYDLRHAVVKNIYKQWVKTGTVWESYNGITGAPKGAKSFTGWSGLVANIMTFPESIRTEPTEGVQDDQDDHDEL